MTSETPPPLEYGKPDRPVSAARVFGGGVWRAGSDHGPNDRRVGGVGDDLSALHRLQRGPSRTRGSSDDLFVDREQLLSSCLSLVPLRISEQRRGKRHARRITRQL